MKIHLLAFLFVILFSFTANSQSEISEEQKTVENLTYFKPLFSHQNPTKPTILYDRFEEISIIALDSVFENEKPKYKIIEKYPLDLTTENETELVRIFDEFKKKETEDAIIPNLKTIGDAIKNNYGIFSLITTKSSTSTRTTPISKQQLEIIIIDLTLNKVIFYKKSKFLSPRNHGGYAYTLIKNLNFIYKSINKL